MKSLLTFFLIALFSAVYAQKEIKPWFEKKETAVLTAKRAAGNLAISNAIFSEDFESISSFPANGITVKTNANDGGFTIGNSTSASTGQFWKVPAASKFAYTNDDRCNCNKAKDSLVLPIVSLSAAKAYHFVLDIYFNPLSNREKAGVLIKTGISTQKLMEFRSSPEWQQLVLPLKNIAGSAQIIIYYSDGGSWGSGLGLDNIVIGEPSESVNLGLADLSYNGISSGSFYSRIPSHHASKLPFDISCRLQNLGANTATNSSVNLAIGAYGNLSLSTDPFSMLPNEDSIISLKKSYLAAEGKGSYQLRLTHQSDTAEVLTHDDTLETEWVVTDTIYSRIGSHENPMAGFWYGPNVNYDLVSLVEIKVADTATSIALFIDELSAIGARFDVLILNEFFQSRVIPQAFPQLNENIEITRSNLGRWNTFKIPDTHLDPGKYYIGIKSRTDSVLVGVKTTTDSNIAYVNIGTGYTTANSLPYVALNTKSRNCALSATFSVSPSSCGSSNGSINTFASGGQGSYTFQWNTNELIDTTATLANLKAGSYKVTISDSVGCVGVFSADLSDAGSPSISVDSIKHERCYGDNAGEINLAISGGLSPYNITWSNMMSGNAISGLAAGMYTITVSDNAVPNCIAVETIEVFGPRLPLGVDFEVKDNFCFNETEGEIQAIVTGGFPSYQYNWSNGPDSTNRISRLQSGSYYVTVTDSNRCTILDSALVGGTPAIIVETTAIDTGGTGRIETVVSGGSGDLSFFWAGPTGFRSPNTKDLENLRIRGVYVLSVTDQNKCTQKDTAVIAGAVGVSPRLSKTDYLVFPNPSSASVSIDFGKRLTGKFELIDLNGRIVDAQRFENEAVVQINKQLPGIYILQLHLNAELFNHRLVFTD